MGFECGGGGECVLSVEAEGGGADGRMIKAHGFISLTYI